MFKNNKSKITFVNSAISFLISLMAIICFSANNDAMDIILVAVSIIGLLISIVLLLVHYAAWEDEINANEISCLHKEIDKLSQATIDDETSKAIKDFANKLKEKSVWDSHGDTKIIYECDIDRTLKSLR